jgi:hypothetical protein
MLLGALALFGCASPTDETDSADGALTPSEAQSELTPAERESAMTGIKAKYSAKAARDFAPYKAPAQSRMQLDADRLANDYGHIVQWYWPFSMHVLELSAPKGSGFSPARGVNQLRFYDADLRYIGRCYSEPGVDAIDGCVAY